MRSCDSVGMSALPCVSLPGVLGSAAGAVAASAVVAEYFYSAGAAVVATAADAAVGSVAADGVVVDFPSSPQVVIVPAHPF